MNYEEVVNCRNLSSRNSQKLCKTFWNFLKLLSLYIDTLVLYYMHLCVCVCVYICVCICVWCVCMRVCVYACMYVYILYNVCVYLCLCVCVSVGICERQIFSLPPAKTHTVTIPNVANVSDSQKGTCNTIVLRFTITAQLQVMRVSELIRFTGPENLFHKCLTSISPIKRDWHL